MHSAVFLPLAAEPTLEILKSKGSESFRVELERLSALGSAWAAVLLAYEALLPGPDGARDIESAIAFCRAPAARGDAYAQYMLAWAFALRGEGAEAIKYFKAASGQLFPPAVLEAGRFACGAWRIPPRAKDQMLVFLRHADSVGHAGTWFLHGLAYRTGKFGTVKRLLGYVIFPGAVIRFAIARLRNPFSARVFMFGTPLTKANASLYRQRQHRREQMGVAMERRP